MKQKDFFNGNGWGNGFVLYSKNLPFVWDTFPQAFFPIVGLFARDSHFHITSCSGNGRTLDIRTSYRGKYGHLYMHYNANPDHRLIVSNIEFIHKRQGQMTELFEILKEIRRAYSTGPIQIECVLSDEMEEWCRKNGFFLEPGMSKNYIWPASAARQADKIPG